ncbi:MAG: hypothetical protein NVSMB3_13020 [Acidobacteriaceae bacterium]
MAPALLMSVMLFQGGDAASSDHFQLLVIFVGVIAFCSFVQFLVFVGAAIAGLKAYKSISAEVDSVKQKAMPLVATAQTLLTESTPKIRKLTDNAVQMSDFVKGKLHEYEGTIDEANQTLKDANWKTRAQVAKVDGMVSSTLKATSDLGSTIHRGIRTPVLEVAGVVNGLKAALDVLVGRSTDFGAGYARKSSTSGAGHPFRGAGSSGPYSAGPGPVPVPDVEPIISSHPSSSVAPSPGAAAVLDRMKSEKVKTIY